MASKLTSLLTAGDSLELQIDPLGNSPTTVRTNLEALVDEDKLVLQTTLAIPAASPLRSNDPVRLVVKQDSAGLLELTGRVLQASRQGGALTLVVEISSEIRQTQRRQFFRLPALRDVHLAGNGMDYHGVTQNISAGGLRCVMPGRIRSGAQVTVELDLKFDKVQLKGRVLESLEMEDDPDRSILRIQFVGTSDKEQSRLISYIFREQSRLKKYQI